MSIDDAVATIASCVIAVANTERTDGSVELSEGDTNGQAGSDSRAR